MTWESHYLATDPSIWQGRPDLPDHSAFFQAVRCINLLEQIEPLQKQAFALLGFCCDEGIRRNHGRTGAFDGPFALRHALGSLPISKNITVYDVGDITCKDTRLESAQLALGLIVTRLLQQQITPIIMGGGHELAWGHYQGIVGHYPTQNIGIVNFDAHFDMRPLLADNQGSSGTSFLQIAQASAAAKRRFDYNCIGIQPGSNVQFLKDTAAYHQVKVLTAEALQSSSSTVYQKFLKRILKDNQFIYVSLCLDVLAQPYAPGVSAPQPFGLMPWQVIPGLRLLAESGKVLTYDIAELSPAHDDQDQRTAKLAAHFIYEIVHHAKFPKT